MHSCAFECRRDLFQTDGSLSVWLAVLMADIVWSAPYLGDLCLIASTVYTERRLHFVIVICVALMF